MTVGTAAFNWIPSLGMNPKTDLYHKGQMPLCLLMFLQFFYSGVFRISAITLDSNVCTLIYLFLPGKILEKVILSLTGFQGFVTLIALKWTKHYGQRFSFWNIQNWIFSKQMYRRKCRDCLTEDLLHYIHSSTQGQYQSLSFQALLTECKESLVTDSACLDIYLAFFHDKNKACNTIASSRSALSVRAFVCGI